MNAITMIKSGLIAGVCASAITLGACASGGYGGDSRYGSVYNYESGGNCNTAPNCGVAVAQTAPAPAPVSSRYGSADSAAVITQPAPVYTQHVPQPMPAPVPAPVYTAQTQYSGPASCPAGTTPSGDGSCMMNSNVESYTGSSTYTGTISGTATVQAEPVSCPPGTTPNGDGTCMMNSGYSGSTYTGSSSTVTTDNYSDSYSGYTGYTGSSTHSTGQMADCPPGTTPNNDGTCMMSSSGTVTSQPSVTVYQGTTTSGYETPSDYVAPVYQPIRK